MGDPQTLVMAIKRFQDAVDVFDAAAAARLRINATDLRCLTALRDKGPMTAGAVATGLGLTRGATTTALDRLQARAFVTRRANAADGRSVLVSLTERGRSSVDATWRTMRVLGAKHLAVYSRNQLALLTLFFERSIDLQESCTRALSRQR